MLQRFFLLVTVVSVLALVAGCSQPEAAPVAPPTAAQAVADAATAHVAEPATDAMEELDEVVDADPAGSGGAGGTDSVAGVAEDEDVTEAVEAVPAHPVQAYGVSAGHPTAVEAGMAVLASGGNAVDAAIASAYAVGVAEPFGSGIGGGGAALVVEQGGYPIAYDYRDVVNTSGVIPASEIGVPGFVAGMEALHADYGTIAMADLIAPSVAIAADGFETYPMLSHQLGVHARRMPRERVGHLLPGGNPLGVGDQVLQPELAETLRTIAESGAAAFYEGPIAEHLSAHVDGLDMDSLADYEVKVREPVSGSFAGYEVVSAPPPLAGATLIQLLQIAEAMGLAAHEPGSVDSTHSLATGWRLANRFRSVQMADPDFVDVVTDHLTDVELNTALAATVPVGQLVDVGQITEDTAGETTHLVVVDADGMMVSMTNTLTNLFGSGDYELGFFLNDQLSNFGTRAANEPPEPGKRAVSSTVPTIVLDAEGRPVLGIGSPGGSRIPLAVAQVMARWALHGEDIQDAVAAPRFHLAGSTLHLEGPTDDVAGPLRAHGYSKVTGPPFSYYFGSVQAMEIDYDAGVVRGGADPRRAAAARVEER